MWGYHGSRGEVTALNGGYGTTKVNYTYGCSPTLRTCPGATTSTYYTTARAMTNWTSSTAHYNVIVGAYDRIGCGAWIDSRGTFFYDCMVSRGGRVAATAPVVARATSVAKAPPATRKPIVKPAATVTAPASTPTAAPTATPPTRRRRLIPPAAMLPSWPNPPSRL